VILSRPGEVGPTRLVREKLVWPGLAGAGSIPFQKSELCFGESDGFLC
jgi:hypothetical protein